MVGNSRCVTAVGSGAQQTQEKREKPSPGWTVVFWLFYSPQFIMSAVNVVAPVAAVETLPRKHNPVYTVLKQYVHEMAEQLRQEYDAGGVLRDNLMKGNHGVRCYMRWQDIVGLGGAEKKTLGTSLNAAVAALLAEFRQPGLVTQVAVTTESAVNHAAQMGVDCLVALYVPNTARSGTKPQADPLGLIYGGLPSELTDLAIRSDLLWHLKAPALYLSDSQSLCKLHATTSFYLPSVEIRKDAFDGLYLPFDESVKCSLMLTADVQCVSEFWEEERESVNKSNLMRTKLLMPFHMALRQNVNRKKLGLPLIRDLVIGDLNVPYWEHGINTLFAQRVQEVCALFDGCFASVTLCGPLGTMMHVHTLLHDVKEPAPTS